MRIRNILLAIIFILIIAGVGGFFYINTLKDPVNAQDTTKKEVTIESGSSGGQIAKILKENGLIKDEKYFLFYANQNKLANLKSGVYEISPSQNLEEILKMLNTGGRPIGEKVTIIEGTTVAQIAELLSSKGLADKQRFISLAGDKSLFSSEFTFLQDRSIVSLEGFLYPETYFIRKGTSEEDIIRMILTQTKKIYEENNVFDIPQNLSPYITNVNQLISLASIVEKESSSKEYSARIAGVFIKRLGMNMPLGSCPTVEYITRIHRGRVTYEETQIDSPFNTYKYKGLTPSPICTPTVESINAVKNFENTDYLFFVAKLDGTLVFTKTYEEHLAATKEIFGEY